MGNYSWIKVSMQMMECIFDWNQVPMCHFTLNQLMWFQRAGSGLYVFCLFLTSQTLKYIKNELQSIKKLNLSIYIKPYLGFHLTWHCFNANQIIQSIVFKVKPENHKLYCGSTMQRIFINQGQLLGCALEVQFKTSN